MSEPIRVVHYINQFFGGIGGEAAAGAPPQAKAGAVGPGRLLEQVARGAVTVVGTVICGDNAFADRPEETLAEIMELVRSFRPDALLAGPAFNAGRYGEACGAVCKAVQEELSIPVITGLAPENPAVANYRRSIPIVQTGGSAADMRNSMPRMVTILLKTVRGEVLSPEEQGWLFKRGLKVNAVLDQVAAERAVEMVLAKYRGEPWQTEMPILEFDRVAPAPPVEEEVPHIAFVTDGGLVLHGNPEGMPSGRSTRWCRVPAGDWDELTPERVEIAHFGYDNRWVLADPNRLVPWDAAKQLEREGRIKLHPIIYSTAGVATAIENGYRFGREVAQELREAGVQAVILTST